MSPHFACVFIHIYAANDLALQVKLDVEVKLEESIELEKLKKQIMG